MKRSHFLYLLCLLLAGLTACGPKQQADPPPTEQTQPSDETPDSPDDTAPPADETPEIPEVPEDPEAIPFFDCGTLDLPNDGERTGRENFEEFLNVTGVGKSASIRIQQYTTEGDPIVSTLTYDGSAYTLKVDDTADGFAADPGVHESSWTRLAITETTKDGVLYQAFRLTNLDEGAVTGDTPDGADIYTLFQELLED